jgi:hypothetical protein
MQSEKDKWGLDALSDGNPAREICRYPCGKGESLLKIFMKRLEKCRMEGDVLEALITLYGGDSSKENAAACRKALFNKAESFISEKGWEFRETTVMNILNCNILYTADLTASRLEKKPVKLS